MSIADELKPMIKRLPWYYRRSQVANDLLDALTAALTKADDNISTECDTLFITTTSDFERHEKGVGLTSDSSLDDETRRAQVIAQLQGYGVFTVAALLELVTLYEPTGCEIVEDYENYTVYIKFTERAGCPDNIDAILSAIEKLKPAHIAIGYEYYANTWERVVDELGYEYWSDLDNMTWAELIYTNSTLVE